MTTPIDAELEAARLAAIVSSSDDAIVSKTLDGIITSWNAAATRILGYQPEEIIGRHITTIIPDDMRSEEETIISRVRRGERVDHFDTVRKRKDGTLVNLSITVSPILDSTGRIVGASKVARDISDRIKQDELQRMLFDELNHRVKNTLATVQALAIQTLRGERTLRQALDIFQGRLMALSSTHDSLSRNSWQSASLEDVVEHTLRPYASRVHRSGPQVKLPPRQAIAWGMLIHELATNAAKYGALSDPKGRVQVNWRPLPQQRIEFDWHESGGPPAIAPQRQGFGTAFVERSVKNELAGRSRFDYRPEGLRVQIEAGLT